MAVITAVELEEDIALRDRAGDANRAHRRLGAARHEAQHFDVRHSLDDQFSEPHLQLGRNPEARAATHCLLERVEYDCGSMTENQRSPRQDEIDVRVAVYIPDS